MLEHPQHADARARGALCEACPLYGCGQGPVVPRVVPDSDVLIIEESPSQKDVDDGHPLAGNSGSLIFDALTEGDVPHARTSTTSVTLCRPPGGHLQAFAAELRRRARAAKGEVVLPETCCAPRLATDLREARPKLVLTLGSEALRAAARLFELPHGAAKSAPGEPRVAALNRQHGAPVLLPEAARPTQVLLGTFHPRFVFAGNTTYLPIIRADVRRAATLALRAREVAEAAGVRPRLLDWETPRGILTPSADVCVNVLDALQRSGQLVTVDIETDGIHTHACNLRCVGLGTTVPGQGEVLVVVPWRRMDGRPWWTPAEQIRVGRALGCMESLPLSGHNLAFDSAVLLRHGFLRARGRHWIDSLVLHHHTTFSELPHDLGFVTSRYFDAPHWKDDADAKVVDGVTDYWLHKYCLFDVAATMRLTSKLIDAVRECGTERSFVVDTKLGPIARDMGTLGLNLDERVRRQFFTVLEAAGKERLATVRSVVGKPDFNPGSFRQVAHYLFQEKGLSPPLSTTGEEWGDFLGGELQASMDPDAALDKAATNEPALLKLLDLGVDKSTEAFIEALLSYRGVQKCQSTYLGLKRDDAGNLLDVFRTRGVMQTESHGPGLENLSILHPAWRVTGTVSGRWSSQPNCQNWSERVVYSVEEYRASKGKSGILNTRAQVTAPPGYVLVGADYKAVELRLYAVQSGDAFMLEALAKGLDPHALNYATMQSSKMDEVQKWYKRVQESDGKVKKYLRNIAKRFCIAEGEPVLVRDTRGAVLERPVEQVRGTDSLWDGVEWVSHDGVVFQGVREVLLHDGLWATEDHEVFLENGGTCSHATAQRKSLRLARGGEAGRPLRFVGGDERGADATGVAQVRLGEVLGVQPRERGDAGEPPPQGVFTVPSVLAQPPGSAHMAVEPFLAGEAALRAALASTLARLRRAWHRVSLRFGRGCGAVDLGECVSEEGVTARQDKQRWALRAGEHPLRAASEERRQPSMYEAHGRVALHRGRLALQAEACRETLAPRMDESADSRTRQGEPSAASQDLAPNRRVVRVFDILNAGPRRRFTVSGRIVHNCFLVLYGGEREKLYNTMAADRNPDGSRSFPDLKPADVQRWWNNWHKTHPETKRWQQRVVREFMRDGYVSAMIDGRKRFCAGGIDPNAACNHTIQSSAAAITNRALIALTERCPFQGWGPLAGPILQVHDFLCLQVPLSRQAEAEALLEECMPYTLPDGFRFDIERKSGAAWSDI